MTERTLPEQEIPTLLTYFGEVEDPRRAGGNKQHQLEDILCIAICAVICGADTFPEIEQYGIAKEAWFRQFLALPNGIPSHDTFNRVFAALNQDAWQGCFLAWVRSLAWPESEAPSEVLAVDGKTARRSHQDGIKALHRPKDRAKRTVSVWASEQGLVLGQAQVPEKHNEITVIPSLLETFDIAGATLTLDAMGTQTQIAWAIREHHGEYLLALKDNHPILREDVQWLFEQQPAEPHWQQRERGHGREALREVWVLADLSFLDNEQRAAWRDLRALVNVRSTRIVNGEVTVHERYFLTSLTDLEVIVHAVRAQWGIENGLHWVLDMAFREDESRVRAGHAQANLVTVRHLALSLLKREKSLKVGIKAKRMRAGWDNAYLIRVLNA